MPIAFATVTQDIRYSLRNLRKSPGFALTAILTLAIGIGAVASVFSVVQSVLLKPFAFPQPDQLVILRETSVVLGNTPGPDNYTHFENWKANAKALADAALFQTETYSIGNGSDHPAVVPGLSVTPGFFHTLGVRPLLGRAFTSRDAVEHGQPVVMLSWSAWQQYFHGDASVIGKTLRSGGIPQTVIGVLPRSFHFPYINEMWGALPPRNIAPYEIYTPFVAGSGTKTSYDYNFDYLVLARLRPGVSIRQAAAELNSLQADFVHAHRLPDPIGALVEPLQQEVTGDYSTALWVLLAAVSAVLLIGCANLANLQLARAVGRERELAVRAALGAGRGRMLWTMLSESVILAVAGGALGILLAFAAIPALVASAPAAVPRLDQAQMSWPVLLLAVALSVVTTLISGMLPALRALRVDPQSAMQSNSSRMAGSREGRSVRNLLVGGEVACTVVLLLVTGLLLSSLARLLTQNRDFDPSQVTLAQADLYTPQYADTDSSNKGDAVRAAFIDRSLAALRQIPGVQSAAMTSQLPMGGDTWIDGIERPDHPLPPNREPEVNVRWVSPDYLRTLRIPLIEGRALQASDRDHPTSALISQQTARAVWPGLDPIGRIFTTGQDIHFTVVGVVADARINDLRSTSNMVYLPYWQNPWYRVCFLIRSPRGTAALAPSIRRSLWGIDPQIAIPVLKSMDAQVDDSVATARFGTLLLSAFGATALLLAFLGIYGVTAYTVSMRIPEFGLRMALGSSRSALTRLVVRQSAVPVLSGIGAGLLLSFLATRSIASLLYQTSAANPRVITAAIALLFLTSLLAALLPGRRAATADPTEALRAE
jgi:predicted permease